jgi:Ca-activated chloride channel homolog
MKLLALTALALARLAAQNNQPEPAPIRLEVTRVSLMFTVQDKKGRFITDLGKDDFEVVENKKVQSILEFTAESDLPLRLAILIDTGNSVRDRFEFQQDAATEFVNTAIRRGRDKAVVMSFNSSPEVAAKMTDDPIDLAKAIRNLRPGGGVALYDALFAACRDKLLRDDEPRERFRRAVILLGDGNDNQSQYNRSQALEMVHKADAVVYSISTNISKIETEGDKVMRYFAQETGGQAYFPMEAADLGQPFANIANELRHQYNVLYRPEPLKADGQYHPVDIRLKSRKDLVVRARRGYYAPLSGN